jgi:hypothetical protein
MACPRNWKPQPRRTWLYPGTVILEPEYGSSFYRVEAVIPPSTIIECPVT